MKHLANDLKVVYLNEMKCRAIDNTCSGARSNNLPPMEKEMVGIDDRVLQSTADSPFGLGSRSQSCKCVPWNEK